MKKILSGISGIILFIIIVGVLVLFFSWSRIPDMLASRLADKLRVSVSIDDVHLSMNAIDIQKLEIGNPQGSVLPKAFSAEQLLITTPISSYLHKAVVIDELEIDNIYLGLEFNSQRSRQGNWTTIMSNLESDKNAKDDHSVLIKRLILTNIDITLAYRDGSRSPRKLSTIPRLEFKNVSSEHGIPTAEISEIIMREMLRSVFSLEGLQDMLQDIIPSAPTQTLEKVFKPFGDLMKGA